MDVQRKINTLEEALLRVARTKTDLKHNVLEAKGDIHSAVSRQLERLRSREVWLLGQVDLVQEAKEGALHSQEECLNQALGGLLDIKQLAPDQVGPETLERHIGDVLRQLDDLELTPEESSGVGFRPDGAKLGEAIRTYGHVFTDHDTAAASLPRAFEDYEDEEHHVLHKEVQHVTQGDRTRQIQVTIPRLSQRPNDWLFIPTEVPAPSTSPAGARLPTTAPLPSPQFTFRPFLSDNLKDWLSGSGEAIEGALGRGLGRAGAASSQASIQQWLCDLHQQAVVDEEDSAVDFEMVPNTLPNQAGYDEEMSTVTSEDIYVDVTDSDVIAGSQAIRQVAPQLPYFRQMETSPTMQWLLSGETQTAASCPYQTLQYFKNASKDIKDWLLKLELKQKEEQMWSDPCQYSCGGDPLTGHAASPTTPTTPVDIESLDQLVCVKDSVSRVFRELSQEVAERWLAARKDDDCDVDEMEVETEGRQVSEGRALGGQQREEEEADHALRRKLCRANEVCASWSGCVSDERCCSQAPAALGLGLGLGGSPALDMASPAGRWLLQPKSPAVVAELKESPLFEYFRLMPSWSVADWVVAPSGDQCEEPGTVFPPFAASPAGLEAWLSPHDSRLAAASASQQVTPLEGEEASISRLVGHVTCYSISDAHPTAVEESDNAYHNTDGGIGKWLIGNDIDNIPTTRLTIWKGDASNICLSTSEACREWLVNTHGSGNSMVSGQSQPAVAISNMFQTVIQRNESADWLLPSSSNQSHKCSEKKDLLKETELPECVDDTRCDWLSKPEPIQADDAMWLSKQEPILSDCVFDKVQLFSCLKQQGIDTQTWLLSSTG